MPRRDVRHRPVPHALLALAPSFALLFCATSRALADEVLLVNGDRLKGTVGQVGGGKLKFVSPVLGELTIDLKHVSRYTTDTVADIRLKDGPPVKRRIAAGDATTIVTEGGGATPATRVKVINPPAQRWAGSVTLDGALARGNTDTENLGIAAEATLRRDDERHDDRFTLKGGYHFERTGRGDASATTSDNWLGLGQYDKFFDERLYGYATVKAERDRIADLNYRLTPGLGLGYQWVERPDLGFRTEAGATYVYEEYATGMGNDNVALRLAYRLTRNVNDRLSLFHTVEWLPAFHDFTDYNLTADAGLRALLTKSWFSELKVEYRRDSTPADGAQSDDVRYAIGVGLTF